MKHRVAVVDGQGGGIGAAIIKELRAAFDEQLEIVALGTNATATMAMLSAGANKGATGENAIVRTSQRVEYIVGSISIIMADAMLGELTPAMAAAIGSSPARKLVVHITQEGLEVAGIRREPLPHHIRELVGRIKELEGMSHV